MPLARLSVPCNNKFFFMSFRKKECMFLGTRYSLCSLFLWDYKHSQEAAVHSSVDINTMNMLASYWHILRFAHMDLRLCKQMHKLVPTALMYFKTCSPTCLSRNDEAAFNWQMKCNMKCNWFCNLLLSLDNLQTSVRTVFSGTNFYQRKT